MQDKERKELEEALAKVRMDGNHLELAKFLLYIGASMRLCTLYSESRKYLSEALSLFISYGTPEERADTLLELAFLEIQKGNNDEAL